MKSTNSTMVLIDMLVKKHGVNKNALISHIQSTYKEGNSFKLYLCGLVTRLSDNTNGLRDELTVNK